MDAWAMTPCLPLLAAVEHCLTVMNTPMLTYWKMRHSESEPRQIIYPRQMEVQPGSLKSMFRRPQPTTNPSGNPAKTRIFWIYTLMS